jgi:hypothetical protein
MAGYGTECRFDRFAKQIRTAKRPERRRCEGEERSDESILSPRPHMRLGSRRKLRCREATHSLEECRAKRGTASN